MISSKSLAVGVGIAAACVGAGVAIRVAPPGVWQMVIGWGSTGAGILGATRLAIRRRQGRERADLSRLLEERELLHESIEVTPTPFALYDGRDRLIAWNTSYRELHEPAFSTLGRPILYADLVREVARRTLPAEEVERAVADRIAQQALATGVPKDRFYPNGRWLRISKQRTRSGAVAGFATDITELKQREAELAASEARYRALAESLPSGIWHIDETGAPLYANPELGRLLGRPDGTPVSDPAMRHQLEGVTALILAQRGRQGSSRFETSLSTAAEGARDVLVVTTGWLAGVEGRESCVATILDITELKAAQARIEHLARHDALTGLRNRTCFAETIEAALAAAERDGTGVSLLAIDLDRFKAVNDLLGHGAGDALLRSAADRMRLCVQPGDAIFRLGGDEFAVIVPDAAPERVDEIAQGLLATLSAPFGLARREVEIGASIGIAIFPADASCAEDLQRRADLALYRVKRQGRCGVARFGGPKGRDQAA